eukprot:4749637-Pleurochrysis_carterae.AAC.1
MWVAVGGRAVRASEHVRGSRRAGGACIRACGWQWKGERCVRQSMCVAVEERAVRASEHVGGSKRAS